MINFKKSNKNLENSKEIKASLERQAYKLHFQLALVHLEQNRIEEKMPDLIMYA